MSDEQQPASEGALAEHNRRAMARQRLEPRPAAERFKEQMLTLMNEFERDRRAEIIAAGGDPDEDRDPFEYTRLIADRWAETERDPERRAALVDELARDLALDEIRAIRLMAEAAAAVTPRLIYEDIDEGMSVAQVADDLGVSEGYVYRILRQRPAADQ